MFKIFIKHCIYEYCIGLTFDNIIKNFPTSQSRFHIGQKFEAIEFEIGDIWWGIEMVEVLYADEKLLIVSFGSGEVHIPSDHDDVINFDTSDLWDENGRYGDELGDSQIIYASHFGNTQVFALDQMKDFSYV